MWTTSPLVFIAFSIDLCYLEKRAVEVPDYKPGISLPPDCKEKVSYAFQKSLYMVQYLPVKLSSLRNSWMKIYHNCFWTFVLAHHPTAVHILPTLTATWQFSYNLVSFNSLASVCGITRRRSCVALSRGQLWVFSPCWMYFLVGLLLQCSLPLNSAGMSLCLVTASRLTLPHVH